MKRILAFLLALLITLSLAACSSAEPASEPIPSSPSYTVSSEQSEVENSSKAVEPDQNDSPKLDEHGYYYSAEDVSLFIFTYNHLPDNFITKSEARELGWEGGSVEKYLEGAAIGGDKFGNREGILPKAKGRQYYECDIDTNGQNSRGAKRVVFSNDGLIYYTDDHYESFTLLYGEE